MISLKNVVKQYGDHTALKGINLEVQKGEILGFLGPNGAGKSTTMNIITGYISYTEGSVEIDGVDILENPLEVKRKIGYLPEQPPLYMNMIVEEYISFVCDIKKVPKNEKKEQINRVLNMTQIENVRGRLIKNLSKGYKQRVGLAQAIVGNPEVIILDEPTVGLDPKQIIEIRNLIKELGKEHTVILSSHIMQEISAVCDRVVIINKGEIVVSGTPDELAHKLNYSNRILLRVKGEENQVKEILHNVDDLEEINVESSVEKGAIDINLLSAKDVDVREKLFYAFSEAKLPIIMMKPMNLDLEQIFLQVTQNQGIVNEEQMLENEKEDSSNESHI